MVKVTSLTLHGTGQLADGTLADRVMPGEEVEVSEGGTRVLTPSPDRVRAPCRHFRTCGGCQMQHASEAFVADWKVGVVEKALQARGLPFPFRALHTSPAQSRRRAAFKARRTKQGATIGFHARGTHTLTDTPDCQLVCPTITEARAGLVALTQLAASRKSEITLIVTETLAGLDVLVETDRPLDGALRLRVTETARAQGFARITWNDQVLATFQPPELAMGLARVVPPPGAFLQATTEGEAALRRAVQDGVRGAKRVVDLFAGCGTFSLPLASTVNVHAVEGSEALVQALDHGWRRAVGLHQVTHARRDLFRRPLEPDELDAFDAAVMDPPRAGAEAQTETLAASDLSRVVMVSCNPVTFARDVARLSQAGFALEWVDVVDQFRWSAHVEVAALLTRT
ncbi:class I SAM-dependent RNA methyltransferase [Roseovarius sp. SYSU LYC5161]|uniref:class I SAM-dependent RNA methyltransferase n=1 Tax=Roseovarius halophilus (ex Wu et al. 2025) TaxID=3376060 RepID=UPI00399B800C